MIRSHWRGWNIVLFEDRASQHTSPDSPAVGPITWGIEVRLLPRATPELNAMDHLWKHTKRETVGSRATSAIEKSALDACQYIIDLSPRDRLRQAGILSGTFWLTPKQRGPVAGLLVTPSFREEHVRRGVETSLAGQAVPGNEEFLMGSNDPEREALGLRR